MNEPANLTLATLVPPPDEMEEFHSAGQNDPKPKGPKMKMPKPDWVGGVFPYYELIQILNFYLDLECWIIPAADLDSWYCVRKYRRRTWPLNYDHQYGKREERLAFNETHFGLASKTKKTVCGTRHGLSDLFVPIIQKGKVIGFLELGDFLKAPPSKEDLRRHWKELTGFEPSDSNIDFLRYVRIVLETPVLEGEAYLAIKQILESYAKVLGGEEDPREANRLAADLKTRVIAPNFHHLLWLEKVIQQNWVYPPTWLQPQMRRWEREELGLGRIPTTVLAVSVNLEGQGASNELDGILKTHEFQREMFGFSKSLPNTMANPLGDFGMLFFTSPDPAKNDVQSKLEILDRIDQLSRLAWKKLRAKISTGVSRCPRPGGNLSEVHRQAITALNFCVPLDRSILFYEDIRTNPTVPAPKNYYEWSNQLIESCLQTPMGNMEASRNQYIETVLAHSAGLPQTIRLHFFYTLGRIVDELRKRLPVEASHLDFLYKTFERRSQEGESIAALIEIFQDSLKGILDLKSTPKAASKDLRLEAAKRYIDENFNRDINLEQVARETGFSESVLGHDFKKRVGMGFSTYLRRVRLGHAQRLLKSTYLSINEISLECGFNNPQYFFDLFKRQTGMTPGEYRGK